MGDERDVGARRGAGARVHRPACVDRPDIADPVPLHPVPERIQHPRRRVERDHLPDPEGERERVPACPRADVEPRLVRPGDLAERIERRVIRSARVGHEEPADRSVEVAAVRRLADALGLPPVGADPGSPGRHEHLRPRSRHRIRHPRPSTGRRAGSAVPAGSARCEVKAERNADPPEPRRVARAVPRTSRRGLPHGRRMPGHTA